MRTFYFCDGCEEYVRDQPEEVTVVSIEGPSPAWFCRSCVEFLDPPVTGRWTNHGYTWTSADGTTVDVSRFSSKRFRGPSDYDKD